MHCSTETSHPKHVVEVDGVGLTSTDRDVVEALCRIHEQGVKHTSTKDLTGEAGCRDRQQAHRSLQRLEDAGVVESFESDVELEGTARKPLRWYVTEKAVESGVIERLRRGEDAPLDPVEERERRIDELEDQVEQLQQTVQTLTDRLDGLESEQVVTDSGMYADDGWSWER